ncbi:MAG: hypothetical protein FJX47_07315 [Alphaproteobacteria bacterium]|nr:hypothetical protein [Alphaproteobacteria bacterium]
MISRLGGLVLFVLAGLAAVDALAQAPYSVRPVALSSEDLSLNRIGRLDYAGGIEIMVDDPDFGGLSGLHVSDDGKRLTAITDRGHWFTATILYDARGNLTGVAGPLLDPLLGPDGKAVKGTSWIDAEALTRAPDGSFVVAFERRHRLWRYGPGAGFRNMRPTPLANPPGIEAAPANMGMEAIAFLADGALLVIAENLRDARGDHQAWLMRGAGIDSFGVVPTGRFLPTDATRLPDGDIALLERRFNVAEGLGIRLTRLPAAALKADARVVPEEIAIFERPLVFDNYEGISAIREPDGRTRLYMVSDNNFSVLQRTLLVSFRLRD